MTRLLTVWIVLIVVAATAACGGDEEQEASQPTRSATAVQAEEQQTTEPAAQQTTEAQQADEEVEEEEPASPPNQAPIADAGEDRTLDLVSSAVNLSAGGSSDPDGDDLTYQWTQISGEPVELRHDSETSPTASFHKPLLESTLVFEVRVSDPLGDSDNDTVTIVLQNMLPIAMAGNDREVGRGETVLLSAGSSSDGDGHSLSYRWTQTSGEPVDLSNPSAATPTFVAPETFGTLEFSLTVHDGFAGSESDFVVIRVVNAPPIVTVTEPDPVPRGAQVTLDASESSDPEGGAITFLWTQVASNVADVTLSDPTSATPTFVAPQTSGTVRLRVEVFDADGGSSSEFVTVSITSSAPVAEAGVAQTVETGGGVLLDGSASSDSDGEQLAYSWSQTAGDQVQLNNAETANPTFTAPNRAQVLRFALTVDDGDRFDTDTVYIRVTYEPVVASNEAGFDFARWTRVYYRAEEDAFSNDVRTDIRMRGGNGDLLLDVVCFDNGSTAIGFRLLGFVWPERDADEPDQLEVMWRLDDGPVRRDHLNVSLLGDTPALYFQHDLRGFDEDWPQVLEGGRLAVRIGYLGIQEEVFDLDAFARTPVHGNLVNCGEY